MSVAIVFGASPAFAAGNGLDLPVPVHAQPWTPSTAVMATAVAIVTTDGRPVCADAVLSCAYAAGPKSFVMPWDLRRSGGGIALTFFKTEITVRRDGIRVLKSVTF